MSSKSFGDISSLTSPAIHTIFSYEEVETGRWRHFPEVLPIVDISAECKTTDVLASNHTCLQTSIDVSGRLQGAVILSPHTTFCNQGWAYYTARWWLGQVGSPLFPFPTPQLVSGSPLCIQRGKCSQDFSIWRFTKKEACPPHTGRNVSKYFWINAKYWKKENFPVEAVDKYAGLDLFLYYKSLTVI